MFRQRGMERERKGERHQCVVASRALPIRSLVHNSCMCPDWEPNQQPFGSQVSAQSAELHQAGQKSHFLILSLVSPKKVFRCWENGFSGRLSTQILSQAKKYSKLFFLK